MDQSISSPQKLNEEIMSLKKQVHMLRSLFIGYVGKDKEGSYRPDFVDEMLTAVHEKPEFEFKNGDSFLARLKRA